MMRSAIFPLLLVLAGILAYSNCLHGEFIMDDNGAILGNDHIKHLWPLTEALSALPRTTTTGRPTICLMMALNYAICGMNFAGYRIANLLVHLLAALTLFGIVRRTLGKSPLISERMKASAETAAFACALLFELHPLQTIAVNYIVQRAESVMALFYLLTFYCAIRGLQCEQARGARARWFVAAVAACSLGMGSKEAMVSAPLMVLLYDRTFQAGGFKEAWRRSRLLYAGLAATWLVLGALLVFGNQREGARWGRLPYTGFEYALTQCNVIPYYLGLALWPRPLCFDYGWPIMRTLSSALPGVAAMAPLVCATLWALWRRSGPGFLAAFFLVAIAPSSSVMPLPDAAAEYRMYLPLAALCVLFVTVLWSVANAISSRNASGAGAAPAALIPLLAAVAWAALLALMTFDRNIDYHSAVAIWGDVARKRPEHARGHANFGIALAEEAMRDASRGDTKSEVKNLVLAAAEMNEALRLKPDIESVHLNLAKVLAMLGQYENALLHFGAAAEADPQNPGLRHDLAAIHYNWGADLFNLGDNDRALSELNESLRIEPQHAEAHFMAGMAFARSGHRVEAAREFNAALTIRPDYADARAELGKLGKLGEHGQ